MRDSEMVGRIMTRDWTERVLRKAAPVRVVTRARVREKERGFVSCWSS